MSLRKGMWVVDSDGDVAIYTRTKYFTPEGMTAFDELHYVDADGQTTGVYTSNTLARLANLLGIINRVGTHTFTRNSRNSKGLFVPASDITVRQAMLEEIPGERRPNTMNGLRLGYK